MPTGVILASGSEIRQTLLRNAGVEFETHIARIDENAIRDAMLAEKSTPRDIVDKLADFKAQKIASKHPGAMVIGCDQVLAFDRRIFSKPVDQQDAISQLSELRGEQHQLLSAAVIYEDGKPVWRHVGVVRLRMHEISDEYLQDYVARNWESIRHCVGAYKLEEEGVRLMARVEGDYFNVLGLPLIELLSYLTLRGVLQG